MPKPTIASAQSLLSTIARTTVPMAQKASRKQCRNLTSTTINSRAGIRCLYARPSGLHNERTDLGALKGIGASRLAQKRTYKTVQEQRSRYRSGPFSALAGLLFLVSGAGLILYFRHEKSRMERARITEASKGVGRPKVGGPFTLQSSRNGGGEAFDSERDMKGRYSLVYFGFSHCPDICPEELDKMAEIIDRVNASPAMSSRPLSTNVDGKDDPYPRNKLLPLFITCDPSRDTPAVLRTYLSEFHKEIIGLTGTWEEIKDVCKKYRVYFSTPENVKKGQDYLVDHSIYFYLMDPEGDFVEAIGRQFSPEQAARVIEGHVGDWRGK